MKFSANLGFLWQELPLPDAIHAAARAGFDAVECHWPYDVAAGDVRRALVQTGLPMLGLNTSRGDVGQGEFGLNALPDRQADAQAAIDQAFDYAAALGAQNVHVMAGLADGQGAEQAFVENLTYACDRSVANGVGVLIEPINTRDVPGYFLSTTTQALQLIDRVARPELKIMFDCYHVALMQGDVHAAFKSCQPHVGHIQFARVPDRGAPVGGGLDYAALFRAFADLGWDAPFGAEYRVDGPTEPTLGWMQHLGRGTH